MSQKLNSAIAVIGIDIGKNSFHVVGHDRAVVSCCSRSGRDLSLDYDEAFHMKALSERAWREAGVPQEIWDQCIAKIS